VEKRVDKSSHRRRLLLINVKLQMFIVLYAIVVCAFGMLSTHINYVYNQEGGGYISLWNRYDIPFFTIQLVQLVAFMTLIFWGLKFSNRIAGPVYRMHTHMRKVLKGEHPSPIALRKKDYFTDVAATYNELIAKHVETARGANKE
jgi:hypothetical protein